MFSLARMSLEGAEGQLETEYSIPEGSIAGPKDYQDTIVPHQIIDKHDNRTDENYRGQSGLTIRRKELPARCNAVEQVFP